MHGGMWKFLLDDDFIHVHTYGMVITCADGIKHWVYPRFFTYSADYRGLVSPPHVLISADQR